MCPGSPWGNSVSGCSTAYPLRANSDMISGSRHQSQPNHLMPFLQHPGSLISTMALLHETGTFLSVMMRHQTVYHQHTKHYDVRQWLWQFFNVTCKGHNSTSFLPRCGVAAGTRSLSNGTHSGTISLATMTTNPGFTVHWSSALDNLCDWLTCVKGVNWYISTELINSSNSLGDLRASSCSILGHPPLIGHSLFPF